MQHEITYVEDVTREALANVNSNGDVEIVEEFDILDTHESSLWCSVCGRIGYDEYAAHGISEEWQIVASP